MKEDEISGEGNHNTALFWEYDTRLGRRWNLDPVPQIAISDYAVNRNNPIYYNDPNGDCPNCITAAVGAGIGALIGGGVEIASQLYNNGSVNNWRAVRGSALQGVITGGAAGFTGGSSLLVTAGVAGGANAVGGAINNKIQGKPVTVLSVATDATIGAVFGAGGKLIGDKISQLLAKNNLIKELASNGAKHSADDIIGIGKSFAGKIFFLEKGNAKAGLQHIIEQHGKEFTQAGVTTKSLPQFLMQAVLNGKKVGMQGTRPIYETTLKGVTKRVAVSTGSNGYIVGANMVSK
jgi:hypothetical protein